MTAAERAVATLGRRAMLGLTAAAALATGASARVVESPQDPVALSVVDRETGEELRVWRYRGRAFVAGRPGARYSLRVVNRTGGRVLAVMSVDGVNILTGETAGYGQRGYVFEPWQSYDISGWRKSETEVAAFNFATLSGSYAARTGRPNDVGVIGIAVFRERPPPPPPPPPPVVAPMAGSSDRSRGDESYEVREAVVTPRAPAARAAPAPQEVIVTAQKREERLGTGHGAREWSVTRVVAFERATSFPQFTQRIEYDSHANLVAAGVIRPRPQPDYRPRPFPAGPGYVPDPPGGG